MNCIASRAAIVVVVAVPLVNVPCQAQGWLDDQGKRDPAIIKLEALLLLRQHRATARMEWREGDVPCVSAVTSGREALPAEVLPHLAAFPELLELDLSGSEIDDATTDVFRHLHKLQVLDLGETDITDAAVSNIVKCRQLRVLDISNCRRLTSTGLRQLSDLSAIRELNLSGINLRGARLEILAAWPQLEQLVANNTFATDDCVESLLKCHNLDNLCVSHTGLTNKGAERLRVLPHLRWLTLDSTYVTDEVLRELAKAPSLETLSVPETGITFAAMRQFMLSSGAQMIRSGGRRIDRVFHRGFFEINDGEAVYVPATSDGLAVERVDGPHEPQ